MKTLFRVLLFTGCCTAMLSCDSEGTEQEAGEDSLAIQEKTINLPVSDSLDNPGQAKVAEEFFQSFLQQKPGECWKLFDTLANKGLTEKQFEGSMIKLYEELPQKDRGFTFYKKGLRSGMGSTDLIVYTYRYKIDPNKLGQPYPPFVLDVVFSDARTLMVAGFLKKPIVDEMKENFTESTGDLILFSDTLMASGTETFKIKFVDLMTFHDKLGLLLAKVEQPLPGKNQLEKWSKEQGLKIAKQLYANGTYAAAQKQAEDQKIDLVKELVICFADPKTGQEHNVLFEEKDYK